MVHCTLYVHAYLSTIFQYLHQATLIPETLERAGFLFFLFFICKYKLEADVCRSADCRLQFELDCRDELKFSGTASGADDTTAARVACGGRGDQPRAAGCNRAQ